MARIFWAALVLSVAAIGAAGAAPPAFDPEQATQAWINTIGPEALARSNAYFTGGYFIEFADAAPVDRHRRRLPHAGLRQGRARVA